MTNKTENLKMNGVGLIIALTVSLSACASNNIFTIHDYKNMTETEIRHELLHQMLLHQTPLGSPKDKVAHFIERQLNSHFKEIKQPKCTGSNRFNCVENEGEVRWRSNLASWGWWKHFFMAGNYVEAWWLFNEDGTLIDVEVVKAWDGI